MTVSLQDYVPVAGADVVDQLRQLAAPLQGMKVVHVNSTRTGGGVAEILAKLVPLSAELGLDARWEVIAGEVPFYQCTKGLHNALQGHQVEVAESLRRAFEETNARNAEELRPVLEAADVVVIHDPQPAPLLGLTPGRKGRWVWRCHIDLSHPYRPAWKYLRQFTAGYDASIFSLADFAQALPHPQYIIPPSIDPLSEKNMELDAREVAEICAPLGLDPARPLVLQVSRFDRFKDPLGVIQAYWIARRFAPDLQLALAGGGAADDPEGDAVLADVRRAAREDPGVRVLALPDNAHRTINALQRAATVVLQKSLREGFGLTVTEAMWKAKPVIGGDAGGIRIQVVNHHTGFLVNTPEGAALRIQYLLRHRDLARGMGEKAREFVRANFLVLRQLREHLTMMLALLHDGPDRLEL